MTDPTAPSGPAGQADSSPPEQAAREFTDLRELLVGREQRAIKELQRRLDAAGLTAEELAQCLPEAIALRAAQDEQLARALAPTLEDAISESVQRNPRQIADAIYPSLGPAIRKAISETMAALVAGINRAIEHSLSVQGFRWRVEAWRTGVPYAQIVMKHALVYRVEQVYLIHAESGLMLAHAAAPDLQAPDADLISGMLTAIRDFVSDSFNAAADGGLRMFTVGELTVMVEQGPRAVLAAVVRGQPPTTLLERLQRTLEIVHFECAVPLAHFEGEVAPFEAAKPLLAECLETVLETSRPRRRSLAPRVAWGAVLVGLVVLAALFVVSHRRWRRALSAVEAEPGLVVLRSERTVRGGTLVGLRDPAARDPAVVLAAAGMDTTHVRATWRPYLSSDPTIVLERARHLLSPPRTVQLAYVGDTLVATGSAATDWLTSAGLRGGSIPGVSRFDAQAVAPMLPATLQPIADTIEASRILFAAGSAELTPTASHTLVVTARALERLERGLGAGWTIAVDLVGRTDTTGAIEFNRALSDERAREVARALVRLGVPASSLTAAGVGTSNPLPPDQGGDRTRQNRSVSFMVRTRPVGTDGGVAP